MNEKTESEGERKINKLKIQREHSPEKRLTFLFKRVFYSGKQCSSRILLTIPRRPVITGVFDSEKRVGGGMME